MKARISHSRLSLHQMVNKDLTVSEAKQKENSLYGLGRR